MKKVYFNMNWPASAVTEMDLYLDLLRQAGLDPYVNDLGRTLTADEALAELPGCYAYVGSTVAFTPQLLDACVQLKVIARTGVGYDAIDVAAATQRGVAVAITPGAGAEAVSEFAMALMLAVARRVTEADRAVRRGDWVRFPGPTLWRKKLAIVGMGQIGKKVAEIARGFDMQLLAYDAYRDEKFAKEMHVTYFDSLDEMLAGADFVTVHIPLTPETKDLIGRQQFAAMKPGAILVNCARGGIVNEEALYEALKNKTIAGAGCDVFMQEPPPPDSPLLTLDNLVATTHNAGTSLEGKNSVVKAAVRNVIEHASGQRPYGIVNPEVLKPANSGGKVNHGE